MNPMTQGLGNARYRELLSKAEQHNLISKLEIDTDKTFTTRLGAFLINLGTQLKSRHLASKKSQEAKWYPSRRVL